MPHKRNPHASERVCGLARLVRGYATTGLENIALWHERDISHNSTERVTFPDACCLVDFMLAEITHIYDGLVVYPDRMLANLGKIEKPASPEFTAAAKVLKELIAHHVEEEERNIWSDVRENFSSEQRLRMNEEFEAAKKRVKIPH